jgi:hypothetical protein
VSALSSTTRPPSAATPHPLLSAERSDVTPSAEAVVADAEQQLVRQVVEPVDDRGRAQQEQPAQQP